MPAPILDLFAEQGAKYELELVSVTGSGVDLASYTKGVMQVRRSTEATSVDKVLEIDNNSVWVEGVTGTGGISLNYGGVTGTVFVEVDATSMGNMPAGKYFYEIELAHATEPLKLCKGKFILEAGAVR
jgi:hypothetical protein